MAAARFASSIDGIATNTRRPVTAVATKSSVVEIPIVRFSPASLRPARRIHSLPLMRASIFPKMAGKNAAPKGRIPSTLWLVVDQLAAGEPLLDERGSFTLEAKVLSPLVVT